MPIYEYACDMCSARFERRQSFGDASAPSCPNGHDAVYRLYSVPGVVFKGSGFYVIDSRGKSSSASDD